MQDILDLWYLYGVSGSLDGLTEFLLSSTLSASSKGCYGHKLIFSPWVAIITQVAVSLTLLSLLLPLNDGDYHRCLALLRGVWELCECCNFPQCCPGIHEFWEMQEAPLLLLIVVVMVGADKMGHVGLHIYQIAYAIMTLTSSNYVNIFHQHCEKYHSFYPAKLCISEQKHRLKIAQTKLYLQLLTALSNKHGICSSS